MAPLAVDQVERARTDVKAAFQNGLAAHKDLPEGLQDAVKNPGAPHRNVAPSSETRHPQSTGKQSVLQAHFAYFDTDGDGIIFPWDTYQGFHKIGFNFLLSAIAIFVIHGTFAYWTSPSWIPDPRLPIYIENAHRCKHGSDSESYDTEGNFVPQKFEEIFSKYSKSRKDALKPSEIFSMIVGQRNLLDPTGWTAATLEWFALWWVAGDDESYITKERARASYDGSLWPILEKEQIAKNARRKQAKAA